MSTILQINFEFKNSPAETRRQGQTLAPAISQVPGLLWKIWLMDEATHQAGGIYLFESPAAAEAYLNGPIGQAIQNHPDFFDLHVRLTPLCIENTAITAPGLIPKPAMV